MRKPQTFAVIALACLLFVPVAASAADHAFSVGYGFAALSPGMHLGRIQGGRNYDFFQFSYLYERPCTDLKPLAVFIEPFAAYVNRPNAGADFGFYTGLKYYPFTGHCDGFFVAAGTGAAYTTIKFKEQGTHTLFTLEASVGYRHGRYYVEEMFRHYSNGATSSPNRSVHASILTVGVYF